MNSGDIAIAICNNISKDFNMKRMFQYIIYKIILYAWFVNTNSSVYIDVYIYYIATYLKQGIL